MKKCKQHKKTQCRKKRHLLTQPRLPWAGWFPLVGRVAGSRVLWVYQHSWLLLSKKAAEYSPAVFLPTLPDSNQQELVRKQKSQLADYSNGLITTFKNLSLSKQFFFLFRNGSEVLHFLNHCMLENVSIWPIQILGSVSSGLCEYYTYVLWYYYIFITYCWHF